MKRPSLMFACAALAAVVLSACGSRSHNPPSPVALLSSSLRALHARGNAKPESVSVQLEANGQLTPLATGAAKQLFSHGLDLNITAAGQGKRSKGTISLALEGRTYHVAFETTAHTDYIDLFGSWYALPKQPVSSQQTGPISVSQMLRAIRRYSGEVLNATVSPGPKLGGPTWDLSGTVSSSGLRQLLESEGAHLTASDSKLIAVANKVNISYIVSQASDLPRELSLTLNLTAKDLGETTGSSPLSSLNVAFVADLSYNVPAVTVAAPAHPQSVSALLRALLRRYPALGPEMLGTVGGGLGASGLPQSAITS